MTFEPNVKITSPETTQLVIQPSSYQYFLSHNHKNLKSRVQRIKKIIKQRQQKGLECQVQCRKNTLQEHQSLPRFIKQNSRIIDECFSFRSKDIGWAIMILFQTLFRRTVRLSTKSTSKVKANTSSKSKTSKSFCF